MKVVINNLVLKVGMPCYIAFNAGTQSRVINSKISAITLTTDSKAIVTCENSDRKIIFDKFAHSDFTDDLFLKQYMALQKVGEFKGGSRA